jgi:CheY-like chemotaxis protein
MARVTVVNDNPEFLELVHDILEDDRYDATPIDGDRPDAAEAIFESRPDVLMIDLRMGSEGMHGWDVAQRVRSDDRFDQLPILLCSADVGALREIGEQLGDEHRIRCIEKPFSIDHLTTAIEELLSHAVPS